MNFDRSLIFCYLEEDNIQRAYFRVRPLLTLEGDVRQEAAQLWPNEGGLRIVPDRNEQHTFKNRMRTLGSYCVVDLRNQPPEAGKIRTNKNFRPDRGEVNQYILYSDTVHELPENTFYQLLDGAAADYAQLAKDSVTPLFFIRQEDTLYGPVSRSATTQPEPAQEAAGVLFELPCPDGVTRMMLCMDDSAPAEEKTAPAAQAASAEAAPAVTQSEEKSPSEEAPAEQVQEESPAAPASEALPIGETLRILDQTQDHEETIKQLDKPVSSTANLLHEKASETFSAAAPKPESLGGTPLIRTPLHVSTQQTKNRTQEVISNQWNVGKYEPPAQNLPNGVAMRPVTNPVEAACTQLREAWNASSAHDQLTDCILSLDGIRALLEKKLCTGSNGTMMQHVLRQRLQDLEAERLTALCELDRARRDVDAYKQELITGLSSRIARETGKLEADKAAAEAQVSVLKQEINALTLQRDALLSKVNEIQKATLPEAVAKLVADAQMAAPVSGYPLRLSPVSGSAATLDEMIQRMQNTCAASGLEMDRNAAIALLVLLAICPRISFACPTPAPAATLTRNLATSMGWQGSFAHQYVAEQQPLVGANPIDATPALLMTSLPAYAPIARVNKLFLGRSTANLTRNAAYDVSQWPIWTLPALPFVDELTTPGAPVSHASLTALTEKTVVSNQELDTLLGPILKAAIPLSGSARKDMYRFVSICAGLMEGALPVAVDWAVLLWVVPALERGTRQHQAVKALLDEYPLSLSKM